MTTARIPARFRGPAGLGNGGYVAGLLAGLLGQAPAEVTLRRGWPLETPVDIRREGEGLSALDATGAVIAEARPATLDPCRPPRRTHPVRRRRGGREIRGGGGGRGTGGGSSGCVDEGGQRGGGCRGGCCCCC